MQTCFRPSCERQLRIRDHARHRAGVTVPGLRLVAWVTLAALVSGVLSGCSPGMVPGALRGVVDGVIQPRISPVAGRAGTRVVERAFTFEDSVVTLRVPVDMAVYAGATRADKRAIFLRSERPPDWLGDYYWAFIAEEHQERFYEALIASLRGIRDARGLDSDRYVELVTAMAQGLEYRVDPGDLAPKFPVETFVDGHGDCDDKTLLAAGILSREGYDVSVFFFGPEEHVALGIRAPGLAHAGTGYAYIETTEPLLVGFVPPSLSGGVRIESRPEVVRIGTGKLEYTAGEQAVFIREWLRALREEAKRLGERIAERNADLARRRAELEAAQRALQTSGVVTDETLRRHGAQVDEYNALVNASNGEIARYNALVEAERFAIEHQTNRREVYRRLKELRL